MASEQLGEFIEAKKALIAGWAAKAGGGGDEDGELAGAVRAALAGLAPLQQILALDDGKRAQVLESLRERGLRIDRLYDVGLTDAALGACARVKLRRERALQQHPLHGLCAADGARLVNALGETVWEPSL